MKSPTKLQQKLLKLLKGTPALHVMPNPNAPWNDLELKEVAWIVQDFVNGNTDVIECDPLRDWLDEYRFAQADTRTF
jgi:hypothetical protein